MSASAVQVYGLDELRGKLTPRLASGPMRRFMRAGAFVVQGRAQVNTSPNAFDGTVLNAFTIEVDPALIPLWAIIANTAEHAIFLEEGTRPHFPPVAAIAPWAEAHGIEPFALALHISRVGTKPHPFLVPALEDSRGDIERLLMVAAREIEAQAGR